MEVSSVLSGQCLKKHTSMGLDLEGEANGRTLRAEGDRRKLSRRKKTALLYLTRPGGGQQREIPEPEHQDS